MMRKPLIIAIEKSNVLAPGNVQPPVASPVGALVFLADTANRLLNRRYQLAQDSRGFVGAPVVNDDKFPISQSLCPDRCEGLGQKLRPVVCRQNNADGHLAETLRRVWHARSSPA